MAALRLILGSFVLTAVFKTILAQQCTCHQHRPENQLGPMSQSATEFLCKDLASAIQNVVLAKMRRNSAMGIPGPSVLGPSGTPGPFVGTTGTRLDANVNDISNPRTCPICAKKWQNALARVLGMTGTNQGQTSALPISATSPVNVPLPYNAIQSCNYGLQGSSTQGNTNAYPSSEIVATNFAANNIANNFGASNFATNNAAVKKIAANNFGANNFATNNAAVNNYAAGNFGANNFATNNAAVNNFATSNFAASNSVANNIVAHNPSANNLASLLSRSIQNNANVFPEVVMMNGIRN